jgi:biopolymer transport protein ExbB
MDYLAISYTEATLKFLEDGGIFIYPLLACSVAGLTAISFKLFALSRGRVIPSELAHVLENAGHAKDVAGEISKHESALSRLAAVALKNTGKDSTQISQAVEAIAREEVVRMHSGIGVLDVVITVSPLLGLLGTASGLVTIFQGLGETTDYLAIARGIAEALSTTIFGLAITVPCVVAHSYFMRRIERLTARMESILTSFTETCSNSK